MATTSATSSIFAPSPHFYVAEKWKLSKKESSSKRSPSSSTTTSSLVRNSSTASSTRRRCAFTRKCARLVKEQRARFYIMRRCVTMLVCWRDYGDS